MGEGQDKRRELRPKKTTMYQISKKDIFYSTEKYNHCFVITLNEVYFIKY